jgi:glycosyltransferase involved in cell wall biosynthesis
MILPPRRAPLSCSASLFHQNESPPNETSRHNENLAPMKLSVVIPVLNEIGSLPATIAALRSCHGIAESVISEIIVSDGGSTDGTIPWLQAQPDIVLVRSIRGKGPQINVGAAAAFDPSISSLSESANTEIAAAEISATETDAAATAATATASAKTADSSGPFNHALLFLHADCLISQPALNALHNALADPQLVGGAFYVRFAESRPRSLGVVAWGINLRARFRNSATGDQGIFVRKSVFDSIGGAPEWPLFEDVELVRRIKQAGKFAVLRTPLTISARRHLAHGVWRTVFLIYWLRFAYWLGVPPQRLKNWFRDARGK